ncbi:YiiX/YebB-like N1pC/P60 family cysteine hydrolase [Vibrio parahaemolyticus]|uniref:YiiX/YebB-like N1pC/P60 family cysteine hydrolase n=1 Tax=Vibrio parahaemolyticus TaxID=670 RepID=UPI001FAB8166|nr:YiiX/YebB-like N1pC/P60 family cysteine hydrolase [Vibrio parahaemolyticus]MCR9807460.1 hypothetical protein [Vibrio parahaemolyticus]MCR9927158.1 hypothetical protein [Vibrio parahaemolyticus]
MQLGDVMLVRGEGAISAGLQAMQQVIHPGTRSSHVLFCLSDGCFIHATGDGGVHLKFVLDELNEVKENWRVIRLRHLPASKRDALSLAGFYFLDQAYNHKFLISGSPHKAFCSELVGKIFQRANIPIMGNKLPHRLTPAHFDREADRQVMWEDVTDECKAYLSSHEHLEDEHRLVFNTLERSLRRNKFLAERKAEVWNLLEAFDPETYSKIKPVLDEASQKARVKFWNQEDRN